MEMEDLIIIIISRLPLSDKGLAFRKQEFRDAVWRRHEIYLTDVNVAKTSL